MQEMSSLSRLELSHELEASTPAQVSRENHAVGAGSAASSRTCQTAELLE